MFWGRDQLHMRKLISSGGSYRGNAEEGCVMWWGQAFPVESDAKPALGQLKASKSYSLPFFLSGSDQTTR